MGCQIAQVEVSGFESFNLRNKRKFPLEVDYWLALPTYYKIYFGMQWLNWHLFP